MTVDAAGWTGNRGPPWPAPPPQRRSGTAALSVTHTADVNSDARYSKVPHDRTLATNYVAWVKAPSGHVGKLNLNWFVDGGSYLSTT